MGTEFNRKFDKINFINFNQIYKLSPIYPLPDMFLSVAKLINSLTKSSVFAITFYFFCAFPQIIFFTFYKKGAFLCLD